MNFQFSGSTLTRINRNRIVLSQRRKDAKFNSTNYLCELCGFARKFFALKCKEFILKVLSDCNRVAAKLSGRAEHGDNVGRIAAGMNGI